MKDCTVILIEYAGPKSRTPFQVYVNEGGHIHGYDVDRSRKYGGLYFKMSSTGGDPYLEQQGRNRWWASPDVEVVDTFKGKRRVLRKPSGRMSPERIMDTLMDGEGGTLCDKCNDFIPEGEQHGRGCDRGTQ